jgi:hypothetical protein
METTINHQIMKKINNINGQVRSIKYHNEMLEDNVALCLGESPPLSTLLVCEVCVGELDGDGPLMGEPIMPAGALEVPPVSALEIPVVDVPLGMVRDESIVGCPAEDGSLNVSELTSPVST